MKIGIAGFGTIGQVVGSRLDAGIKGAELVAVSSGNLEKAQSNMALYKNPVQVTTSEELAEL
ncbi:MAG: aspartate dehydrogenase, partial [Kordiimonadaceae bacterium]|nr:aspartate dehydrogenase [Kordiimonadaceae bacterium]